jgi:hypothetical protein
VGTGLDGDAHRPLRSEAPSEGFWGGAQSALFDHLAAFGVQNAEMAVFVPEIYPYRTRWLTSANIPHGPILLPYWALEPVEYLQTPRVLRNWGVGLLIPSSENCVTAKFNFVRYPSLLKKSL